MPPSPDAPGDTPDTSDDRAALLALLREFRSFMSTPDRARRREARCWLLIVAVAMLAATGILVAIAGFTKSYNTALKDKDGAGFYNGIAKCKEVPLLQCPSLTALLHARCHCGTPLSRTPTLPNPPAKTRCIAPTRDTPPYEQVRGHRANPDFTRIALPTSLSHVPSYHITSRHTPSPQLPTSPPTLSLPKTSSSSSSRRQCSRERSMRRAR